MFLFKMIYQRQCAYVRVVKAMKIKSALSTMDINEMRDKPLFVFTLKPLNSDVVSTERNLICELPSG